MPVDTHAKLIRVKVLLHNHQLWRGKWAGECRGIYLTRTLQDRWQKTPLSGILSFVAWGPITFPQEPVIGPAKCQIDQVLLAGIVCCRVSAPVHSSKCCDPSDSWSEVWTWPAVCGSGVPRLAWLRAAYIVHTLLSLSAVPLECKPLVSHQCDRLGPHFFCCRAGVVWVSALKYFAKLQRANYSKEQLLGLNCISFLNKENHQIMFITYFPSECMPQYP